MNLRRTRTALALLAALAAALPAAAQTAPPEAAPPDSRETRNALYRILDRVSPELGMVLKLDPALVGNQNYVAAYPELAAFLAQHPEIAAHPGYFFEDVAFPPPRIDVDSPQRMVMDILGASAALIGFLAVVFTLAWLVKSLMAQRRWSHVMRVQTEAHNKLLDRLGSNEELLTYIQSSAGRRFLESAPIHVDEAHPGPRAPIARLLWSVQAGLVLVAGGIGLQFVSTGVPPGGAEPLSALGILAIAVGVGFVLSAIVAFVVTRKLGLWSPAAAAPDRGAGA
jgi:hypothetical protein